MTRQGEVRRAEENGIAKNLANGLGWFSIGLGVAELVMPEQMEKVIGVRDRGKRRNVLRAYGAREIAAGLAILSQPRQPGWLWTRVAGDIVDLATLGSAMRTPDVRRGRVAIATAAVAGVTVLDVIAGAKLSHVEPFRGEAAVLINRPPEDLYNFWRDPSNLVALEPWLESVHPLGNQQWRWRAKAAGRMLEIETQVTEDEPNRLLAWRSTENSPVLMRGRIEFQPATANHGTRVRARLEMHGPVALAARPASALGLGPELRLEQHLRRFKQLMETGEIARTHEERHPSRERETAPPVQESQPEPALTH